jgi:hypothetical protein
MTRDERETAEGFVAVDMGEDEYHCPVEDYDIIYKAWTGVDSFVHTHTMYDETCILKCARIMGLTLTTPESFAERKRNDKERREREITENS